MKRSIPSSEQKSHLERLQMRGTPRDVIARSTLQQLSYIQYSRHESNLILGVARAAAAATSATQSLSSKVTARQQQLVRRRKAFLSGGTRNTEGEGGTVPRGGTKERDKAGRQGRNEVKSRFRKEEESLSKQRARVKEKSSRHDCVFAQFGSGRHDRRK